ncbi:MAG: hypothetical protein JWQ60_1538 [Pseudonocardia sp.]|nr:hypothetical protein [Pseudonocardia sp.]
MNAVVTPPLSCCQTLPMEPFASAVEHARLADELGYDSVVLRNARRLGVDPRDMG